MLLTNQSWSNHFTCDVTVTSFYMGVTPNCNTTSTIYSGTYLQGFSIELSILKLLSNGFKQTKAHANCGHVVVNFSQFYVVVVILSWFTSINP